MRRFASFEIRNWYKKIVAKVYMESSSGKINTREEFEKYMRKWAMLDNKIRESNAELKEMRKEKENASATICDFLKSKGLEKKKIETGDSVITFYEKNEFSSLTFGYLEKCLGEIIPEKDSVEYIIKYLKDKREIKKTNDLRRVFSKKQNTSGYETDE